VRNAKTAPHAEITAERDPSALDKLVDPPSQIVSLFSTLKATHSRRIPSASHRNAATLVEVQDIWSKKGKSCCGPFVASGARRSRHGTDCCVCDGLKPRIRHRDSSLLIEPIQVSLPTTPKPSHGGGGGGTKYRLRCPKDNCQSSG